MEKKKKRFSFKGLTYAQIMTQRLAKTKDHVTLNEGTESSAQFKHDVAHKKERRKSASFKDKLEIAKKFSTGASIANIRIDDTDHTYASSALASSAHAKYGEGEEDCRSSSTFSDCAAIAKKFEVGGATDVSVAEKEHTIKKGRRMEPRTESIASKFERNSKFQKGRKESADAEAEVLEAEKVDESFVATSPKNDDDGNMEVTANEMHRKPLGDISSQNISSEVEGKPSSGSSQEMSKKKSEANVALPLADSDIKSRVRAFYAYYNPDKLRDDGFLEAVCRTYEGHDDILIEQLKSLYGPEPHTLSDRRDSAVKCPKPRSNNAVVVSDADFKAFEDRVRRFYAHYNPAKLKQSNFLETVLRTYAGHESILMRQLVALYGPEISN